MSKLIKLYPRVMFSTDISSMKKTELEERIEKFLLNYQDFSSEDVVILLRDYFSEFHDIVNGFVRSLVVEILGNYNSKKHSKVFLKKKALNSFKHSWSHTFSEDFIKSIPWDYDVVCDHQMYRIFSTKFTVYDNLHRSDLVHVSFLPYMDENGDRNFNAPKSHDGRFTNVLPNDLFINDALITSLSNYIGRAKYTAVSIGECSRNYHYGTSLVRDASKERTVDYEHSLHYEFSVKKSHNVRHTAANPMGVVNMFKNNYFLYQGDYYFAVYVDGMLILKDDDDDQAFPIVYSQLIYFLGVFLDFIENHFSPKKTIKSFVRFLFSV